MRLIPYLAVNFVYLTILGVVTYENYNNEASLIYLIIKAVIILLIVNFILFILETSLNKLINYLVNLYEKRKMKNSNLYEWMRDTRWLDLMERLSNLKEFSNSGIHENYQLVKKEIRNLYDTTEKLNSLKIYLEVIVESPKLTILNTVTQTVLLAMITTSLISFIKGFMTVQDNSYFGYLLVVVVIWFVLLASISFITKEINRDKLLLKLVLDCLSEDEKAEKEKTEQKKD